MNRWEYRVFRHAADVGAPASRLQTFLGRLGEEGWECWHMEHYRDGDTEIFTVQAKRPVPDFLAPARFTWKGFG